MNHLFGKSHKSLRIYRRLAVGSVFFALGLAAVSSLQAFPASSIARDVTSQRQPLESTHSLYVEGPADVILRQGDEEYVKVTGLPKQLEKMYTRIHGKRLHIEVPRNPNIMDLVVVEVQLKHWKKVNLERKVQRVEWDELRSTELSFSIEGGADVAGNALIADELDINISGRPQVDIQRVKGTEVSLDVSGAGNIKIGAFSAENAAELELSGSGELEVKQVTAEEVEVEVAGSGEVDLGKVTASIAEFEMAGSGQIEVEEDGRVNELSIDMSGSAAAQVKPLQAKDVDIAIAGSGDVDVTALNSLKISVAGSGKVRYWGNPHPVKKSIIGSASVRHMSQPN